MINTKAGYFIGYKTKGKDGKIVMNTEYLMMEEFMFENGIEDTSNIVGPVQDVEYANKLRDATN